MRGEKKEIKKAIQAAQFWRMVGAPDPRGSKGKKTVGC
jgi:hypothetical protein